MTTGRRATQLISGTDRVPLLKCIQANGNRQDRHDDRATEDVAGQRRDDAGDKKYQGKQLRQAPQQRSCRSVTDCRTVAVRPVTARHAAASAALNPSSVQWRLAIHSDAVRIQNASGDCTVTRNSGRRRAPSTVRCTKGPPTKSIRTLRSPDSHNASQNAYVPAQFARVGDFDQTFVLSVRLHHGGQARGRPCGVANDLNAY